MKVLFVSPFFEPAWSYGGIVQASSDWGNALSHYTSVDVYTTTANGNRELDVEANIPFEVGALYTTYFSRNRWGKKRYVSLKMAFALKRNIITYDIVHIIGIWSFTSMITSRLCLRKNVPYVVSLHGMLMPWALKYHSMRKKLFLCLIERYTLRNAAGVICSTDLEKVNLLNLNIVSEDKIKVISNIMKLPLFDLQESRSRFRTIYNLNNSKALIFSGRLVINKGLHLSIAAFAKIIGEHPDCHFFIAGPEEDKSFGKLKKQIYQSKFSDKIHYLGMLTDQEYWDALSGADLFILNSYGENFGIVVTEALSIGRPVLISDQVGIKDLVTKYRAGIVTTLEIDKIAGAMRFLLADSEKLKEMGQRGIALVNENFTVEIVGKQLYEYFEKTAFEYKR